MTERVLVVIPAYNESGSIHSAVSAVKAAYPESGVLVVDDGSTDDTAAAAERAGAAVIRLLWNLGIGGAVQTGLRYARQNGYAIAVQFDGDNQHPAESLAGLCRALQENRADLAVGSRFIQAGGYKTPALRRPGVWLLSGLLSRLLGVRLTDTTSGFRAFGRRAIDRFAPDYPQYYPEPECLVTAVRSGLSVCEIPVRMHPRRSGDSSIGFWTGLHYMFTVLMNVFVAVIRPADPPEEE